MARTAADTALSNYVSNVDNVSEAANLALSNYISNIDIISEAANIALSNYVDAESVARAAGDTAISNYFAEYVPPALTNYVDSLNTIHVDNLMIRYKISNRMN